MPTDRVTPPTPRPIVELDPIDGASYKHYLTLVTKVNKTKKRQFHRLVIGSMVSLSLLYRHQRGQWAFVWIVVDLCLNFVNFFFSSYKLFLKSIIRWSIGLFRFVKGQSSAFHEVKSAIIGQPVMEIKHFSINFIWKVHSFKIQK